ncbi:MAG TPA: primary-amine oxidase [Streptosporangiaceae bacterium]|jgi:primary-amine oxidase|nr:primary-amine oxidase [Streptosporangiaceae bacterium]
MTSTATHPLDPLSAEEIRRAVTIIKEGGRSTPAMRFVSIGLHEPAKSVVEEFEPGQPFAREAFVVALEPREHMTYEGVVSLTEAAVVSWRPVPGARAPVTAGEYEEYQRVVRADQRFREGLRRRGIEQPDQVLVEPWGIGTFAREEDAGRRLIWSLCFYRASPGDNPYAKPIHGLHAIVDLDDMAVVRVEDLGIVPLPPGTGDYPARTNSRPELKPLEISQPDGVSFGVDGWEVRWQKWRLRIGFNAREGLVLHTVGYEDDGRLRSVLHRASIAELVIPYADPRPFQGWRNAFDIGEYGIGMLTNSLELGCDCLGEIRYLDAVLADDRGEPYTIRNAICLHEEDNGLGWKHFDGGLKHAEVRRRRRLVVSFIITAGNYEYAFYWYFYTDGAIELEVKLTGIVLTSAIAEGEVSDYGTIVAAQTLAAHHQHFFSVRLDMAVDGAANSVYEVETEAVPDGSDNPYGNAFRPRRTLLRTESEAQRLAEPRVARHWLVVNPGIVNGLGQPVGYKLVPEAAVLPFAAEQASVIRRARFMMRHLWVTPFAADERFPAGEYPNQHEGEAGLPEWTKADRPIESTDIVLWYTLGSHHIPRPEDWPVMPVERVGFALKPVGFFDQNPALDMPPRHGR